MLVERFELVEIIIGPFLHHLPPFRQILGPVVNTAYLFPWVMGKLFFDHIGGISLLIEQGGSHSPEPVSAHFFLGVPHTPQGRDKGGITEGFVRGTQPRKHQATVPAHIVKRMQDCQRLRGKGHQMVIAHLHAFDRNTPKVFLKVNFRPLSKANFTGAQERQRQELQASLDSIGAGEIVYRPQEAADSLWIGYGRTRRNSTAFQRSAKVGSRVAFGAARGDGISENQGTDTPYPMGLVNSAANFNFAKDCQQFRRGDFRNGTIPRYGKIFLTIRSITSLA